MALRWPVQHEACHHSANPVRCIPWTEIAPWAQRLESLSLHYLWYLTDYSHKHILAGHVFLSHVCAFRV